MSRSQDIAQLKQQWTPTFTKHSLLSAILFSLSVRLPLTSCVYNHILTPLTAGHVAFFGFMAELRDPKDYPKSLCLLQGIDLCLYLVASVVIYVYAGQDVTSPALGSASPVIRKVAYGVALPTVSSPFSFFLSLSHTINIYPILTRKRSSPPV